MFFVIVAPWLNNVNMELYYAVPVLETVAVRVAYMHCTCQQIATLHGSMLLARDVPRVQVFLN